MSQNEPYVVLHRTDAGVKYGGNFSTIRAARRKRALLGYNTIAQKRRGRAGYTIVESYTGGRK